jgi:hypothetical protein
MKLKIGLIFVFLGMLVVPNVLFAANVPAPVIKLFYERGRNDNGSAVLNWETDNATNATEVKVTAKCSRSLRLKTQFGSFVCNKDETTVKTWSVTDREMGLLQVKYGQLEVVPTGKIKNEKVEFVASIYENGQKLGGVQVNVDFEKASSSAKDKPEIKFFKSKKIDKDTYELSWAVENGNQYTRLKLTHACPDGSVTLRNDEAQGTQVCREGTEYSDKYFSNTTMLSCGSIFGCPTSTRFTVIENPKKHKMPFTLSLWQVKNNDYDNASIIDKEVKNIKFPVIKTTIPDILSFQSSWIADQSIVRFNWSVAEMTPKSVLNLGLFCQEGKIVFSVVNRVTGQASQPITCDPNISTDFNDKFRWFFNAKTSQTNTDYVDILIYENEKAGNLPLFLKITEENGTASPQNGTLLTNRGINVYLPEKR